MKALGVLCTRTRGTGHNAYPHPEGTGGAAGRPGCLKLRVTASPVSAVFFPSHVPVIKLSYLLVTRSSQATACFMPLSRCCFSPEFPSPFPHPSPPPCAADACIRTSFCGPLTVSSPRSTAPVTTLSCLPSTPSVHSILLVLTLAAALSTGVSVVSPRLCLMHPSGWETDLPAPYLQHPAGSSTTCVSE